MLGEWLAKLNAFLDRPYEFTALFNKEWHSGTNPNTGKAFFIISSPTRPNRILNYNRKRKPYITNLDVAFLFACEQVCLKYGRDVTAPNFKANNPIRIMCVPHGYFDQKKFSRFAGDKQKRQALTINRKTAAPIVLVYPEMFDEWIAHELIHVAEELYNIPQKLRHENHNWVYFMEDKVAAYLGVK